MVRNMENVGIGTPGFQQIRVGNKENVGIGQLQSNYAFTNVFHVCLYLTCAYSMV